MCALLYRLHTTLAVGELSSMTAAKVLQTWRNKASPINWYASSVFSQLACRAMVEHETFRVVLLAPE